MMPDARLSPQAGAREAVWASFALLALLGVGKSIAPGIPFGGDLVFTAAAAFQLYVPLWLIQRAGETPESHGIHAHGILLAPSAALRRAVLQRLRATPRGQRRRQRALLRVLAHYGRGARFDPAGLGRDLKWLAIALVTTFPPFAVAHHFFQAWRMRVDELAYAFRWPPDVFDLAMKNTLLVALPEEIFYRGFLEKRLERLWPTRWHVFAIPLSRTVFVASALFALGHFIGEWNPARLGPFFPAFVFSALTRKSGSIFGAVLYHGLSNVFSATLLAGYR